MNLQITSQGVQEIIKEISQKLNTPFFQNYGRNSIKVEGDLGHGEISAVSFKDGLNLIQYKGQFEKVLSLRFQVTHARLIFLFGLSNNITLEIENHPKKVEIKKYQNVILLVPSQLSYTINFEKKEDVFLNALEFSEIDFDSPENSEERHWHAILDLLLENRNTREVYCYTGGFNLKTGDLFKQMEAFQRTGILKNLFFEAKCHEILVNQLLQYEKDLQQSFHTDGRMSSEAEFISSASEILRKEIINIKTIKALARRVGSNNNKLQSGFKKYYGQTVNAYMNSIRMEKGRDLLISTDYNVSEIVDRIGLSSKSYFSKMFRERYGMSPSEFRKKVKEVSMERKSKKLI